MSANKNLWLATASAVVLFASAPAFAQNTQPNVTVVQPDGPAERAGEAVDNAASAAGNAASNAATAAGNAANNAATAAGNAAENTANAASNAAEDASQAAQNAAETAENAAENAADNAQAAADNATETDTAEAETPVQGQIFDQSPDQYLASTLLDAVVMNPANEEIGDVNDMIVNKDGSVQGVVIGVGGFLGIGEKNVAIELSRLQITEDENNDMHFVLDATQDELSNAPQFVTAEDRQSEAEANSAAPAASTTMGGGMGTTAPAAPAAAQ